LGQKNKTSKTLHDCSPKRVIGEGRIYLAAFGELEAVCSAALDGTESLAGAARYEAGTTLTSAYRVWILAKKDEADTLAQHLAESNVPFAMLTAQSHDHDCASAFLSMGIDKGLLPGDEGERIVIPHALGALYVYHAVKLTIDEMLAE
jgi:hypothetical protein